MSAETEITEDNVIQYLIEKSKSKFGLFSINYILINCKIQELLEFIADYGITIPEKSFVSRLEYIKLILTHLTNVYNSTDCLPQKFRL